MLDSPIPQLLCLSEQHQVQMVFSGLMSVAAEISLCARFETCSFLCLLDMMELTQCQISDLQFPVFAGHDGGHSVPAQL